MNNFRLWHRLLQLTFTVGLGVVQGLPVQAQVLNSVQSPALLDAGHTFAIPSPPRDVGAPRRRSSAGSRGCATVVQNSSPLGSTRRSRPLTALVPAQGTDEQGLVGGLTTSKNPTFWFYIPEQFSASSESEHYFEFVLKDSADNYVYQTQLAGPETPPGIVSLHLPPNVGLEANQTYEWYFVLFCGPRKPLITLNGDIQRIERPELESQLGSATVAERVNLYRSEGIWYDALTPLASLYRSDPQNAVLRQDWMQLLRAVQLEFIAAEPFSPCCAPQR